MLERANKFGLRHTDVFTLVLLSFLATATEIFGIGIFLPIFQFIRHEGNVESLVHESHIWEYIINGLNIFSLDPTLIVLLLVAFSFFISRQVITYLRLIYTASVKHKLVQILRNRAFNRYISTNSSYQDSVSMGKLVNIIVTEINRAVAGILAPLDLLVYLIMFIGYLIILAILSWEMTFFSTIIIALTSIIPSAWIKQSAVTGRDVVNANSLISDFLVGRIRSSRLVRLSGTESEEKDEFCLLTMQQKKHMMRSSILQAKTDVVMEPLIIGASLIFLYLSYSIFHLSIEVIGLYLVIAMRLMPIVKSILKRIQHIKNMLGSIEVLENRLNLMKQEKENDVGLDPISKISNSISFSRVFYKYKNKHNFVLRDVYFELKIGEITSIVGPSGSGKSTLIDMIPRLRTPTDGEILFDGNDINKYQLKDIRKLISYVAQEPQLFSETIKDHICYGKKRVSDNNLGKAVCLAGLNEVVDVLPQGLDTKLDDNAINLSGGQRQRIDIARALLNESPILILDEPTSNLDAESEYKLMNTLDEIKKKTNTIIILVSHRLKSIINSDKIIVLVDGCVESAGSHSDLIKNSEWYARAWNT